MRSQSFNWAAPDPFHTGMENRDVPDQPETQLCTDGTMEDILKHVKAGKRGQGVNALDLPQGWHDIAMIPGYL